MESVYLQLSRYIPPIIIFFGTVGALSNQILFYFRKQLRTTSCALYFRALSANDLLVLWFVIFPQWLNNTFNINPAKQYEWYCKLWSYLTYVLYTLSPYFIVLACFDRLCTSSTHARLRKIATIRIAFLVISTVGVLVLLAYSHILFECKLVITSSNSICVITDFTYNRFLAFFILFIYCVMPPFLMIIFCSITFILLRQQRHRVMPVNQARLRQRDNQLLKMLFIYVTSNIVCIVPFSVTYFILINYQGYSSSILSFLTQLFSLIISITYATSFYIYTLGTPFYRDELNNLFKSIWRRLHRNIDTAIDLHRRRVTNAIEE